MSDLFSLSRLIEVNALPSTRRNLASFRRFVEARLDERHPVKVIDPASPLGLSALQEWQDCIEREFPQ